MYFSSLRFKRTGSVLAPADLDELFCLESANCHEKNSKSLNTYLLDVANFLGHFDGLGGFSIDRVIGQWQVLSSPR